MTEDEARAALAAFVAVGDLERWVAEQRWEAVPGGWTALGELHGLGFRLALVPGGVRIPGLPRTNNGLEQLFGSQRHHERRATGRRATSPAAVLRGEVRLIAAVATRLQPPTSRDLGRVSREQWRDIRRRLDQRRQARTLRTRFRRDPTAYLAALEQQVCQPALPT